MTRCSLGKALLPGHLGIRSLRQSLRRVDCILRTNNHGVTRIDVQGSLHRPFDTHTHTFVSVRPAVSSRAGRREASRPPKTHTHTHTHTHTFSRITTCAVNRTHAGVGLEPTKLRDNRQGRTDSVTGPVPRGPCGNPASRTCHAMLTKRLVPPTRCRQPCRTEAVPRATALGNGRTGGSNPMPRLWENDCLTSSRSLHPTDKDQGGVPLATASAQPGSGGERPLFRLRSTPQQATSLGPLT